MPGFAAVVHHQLYESDPSGVRVPAVLMTMEAQCETDGSWLFLLQLQECR
jgi:hypothetical protein